MDLRSYESDAILESEESTAISGLDESNVDDTGIDEEPVTGEFKFVPSMSLWEMETQLSGEEAKYVGKGKAKETLVKTFMDAVHTDVAKRGFDRMYENWQSLTRGPQAEMVFQHFGQNYKKILLSPKGANTIKTLTDIAYKILFDAADDKRGLGLIEVLKITYKMLAVNYMPDVVSHSGDLIVDAVDKENSYGCVKQFFIELNTLMKSPDLDKRLNKYFTNLKSMMKSMGSKKGVKDRKDGKDGKEEKEEQDEKKEKK